MERVMADAEAEKGEEKNDEERNTALRTSLSDAYEIGRAHV